MKFDPKKFETLNGLQLGQYTMELAKEGLTENDILPYVEQNAAAMDLAHLESALYWLGEIATNAAYQVAARYLDHPAASARFIASKTITKLAEVDEHIMERVVAALATHGEKIGLSDLRVVLDRPANPEARRIAQEYRTKHSSL